MPAERRAPPTTRRQRLLAAIGPIAILVYDEDHNGRLGPPGRPMTAEEYAQPILRTLEQLERVNALARNVLEARKL